MVFFKLNKEERKHKLYEAIKEIKDRYQKIYKLKESK